MKGNFSWNRYGPGLYFSSTSSKANDYTWDKSSTAEPDRKAVMLCEVALGGVYPAHNNGRDPITKKLGWSCATVESLVLDKGLHTVAARKSVKGINYDETVVYTSGQGTPSYVVVYDQPTPDEFKRRGNEHFGQGKFEDAVKDYTLAIALEPANGTRVLPLNLASSLRLMIGTGVF